MGIYPGFGWDTGRITLTANYVNVKFNCFLIPMTITPLVWCFKAIYHIAAFRSGTAVDYSTVGSARSSLWLSRNIPPPVVLSF